MSYIEVTVDNIGNEWQRRWGRSFSKTDFLRVSNPFPHVVKKLSLHGDVSEDCCTINKVQQLLQKDIFWFRQHPYLMLVLASDQDAVAASLLL